MSSGARCCEAVGWICPLSMTPPRHTGEEVETQLLRASHCSQQICHRHKIRQPHIPEGGERGRTCRALTHPPPLCNGACHFDRKKTVCHFTHPQPPPARPVLPPTCTHHPRRVQNIDVFVWCAKEGLNTLERRSVVADDDRSSTKYRHTPCLLVLLEAVPTADVQRNRVTRGLEPGNRQV